VLSRFCSDRCDRRSQNYCSVLAVSPSPARNPNSQFELWLRVKGYSVFERCWRHPIKQPWHDRRFACCLCILQARYEHATFGAPWGGESECCARLPAQKRKPISLSSMSCHASHTWAASLRGPASASRNSKRSSEELLGIGSTEAQWVVADALIVRTR
jgi:hypothetical protein